MTTSEAIGKAFEKAMKLLQGDLRDELKAQGHYLTGRLHNSIQYTIEETETGVVAKMECADYGLAMELGVPASRIPYSPGSGAQSSKYIQGLITFFERRGLAGREAVGAAFATAKKQKRDGMPTHGSYRFSSNGKRTGFATDVLQRDLDLITKIMEEDTGFFVALNLPTIFPQKMEPVNFYM